MRHSRPQQQHGSYHRDERPDPRLVANVQALNRNGPADPHHEDEKAEAWHRMSRMISCSIVAVSIDAIAMAAAIQDRSKGQ
jgi:hypothetical protein